MVGGDMHRHLAKKFFYVPDGYGLDPCDILHGNGSAECNPTPDELAAIGCCQKDPDCEKEVALALNLLGETWNNGFLIHDCFVGFGTTDTCTRFANNYMTGKIAKMGNCKKLSFCKQDWNYCGSWPLWDHHSVIRICFPNGKCIYIDQGWLGGADHIIRECDVSDVYEIPPLPVVPVQ
jgi:hypothetical protein